MEPENYTKNIQKDFELRKYHMMWCLWGDILDIVLRLFSGYNAAMELETESECFTVSQRVYG